MEIFSLSSPLFVLGALLCYCISVDVIGSEG